MIVLGGMGNVPGVIIGALAIYFILHWFLPILPPGVESFANTIGLGSLNQRNGDWPGLGNETQNLTLLIFGLILVTMMLLRPQGIFPSRVREQELKHALGQEDEAAIELTHAS
jgi:branched-chain amino acid transport system permease protein